MEQAALKKMRTKQLTACNLIAGIMIVTFSIFFQTLHIQLTHLFFCLGLVMLVQSILGFLKKKSTKSFIPIFEQVAIYEKEKLGKEWEKEQRTENISRVVLSGLMFLQSFSFQDVTNPFFEIQPAFLFFLLAMFLVIMNVSMLFRFRKIDRSIEEHELQGYTKESNMMGLALGLLSAIIIFGFIVIFILP
ncbi:hypothetical protein FO510_18010 [Bacillus pumilus]|uniref:hypothetical protein n=1 Tax=Bacillus pumilus TaxID=1408 RepID=UPI00017A6667|nr:hypothetical protein [Bacillus pumilus]EDW19961.1 hypothetical membrane protein [Bacillus pumilus ATCC 7061]MCR4355216.1 hypothetical protein [Bacillus pumilus]MCY7506323.1 hypothetical protein [Bacillus pumilus]MDR4271525.1 hypothetical protein [Bacillus pumilus]MED4628413.1 hypothetical protein [Bacillus pumilus]